MINNNAMSTARKAGLAQGIIMVLTGFLPTLAIISLAPAVPTLVQHFSDIPQVETLVPLMLTAPGLMIALLAPFAGWFADKVGKRRMLIAATVLYGVCGTMPLYSHDFTMVFLSRLGVGVAEAAVLTLANTLLVQYFNVRRRRLWLTLQGFIGPSMASVVIACSGYLTAMDWNGAFWIYAIAFPLALAMKIWVYEPDNLARHDDEPAIDETVFPMARIAVICMTTFIMAIVYSVYIINAGTAFHALSGAAPERIGLMMSLASLSVPIGGLLFGWATSRLSPERTLCLMLALLGTGMVVMSRSDNPVMMGAGAVIQQIGSGMAVSTMIFWVASLVGPAHRGRAMGVWSAAFFLGMFLSPLVVSAIRTTLQANILVPFFVLGCVAIALTFAIFFYTLSGHGRSLRKPMDVEPSKAAVS